MARVYLAGPINGCSDSDATDWREYAKKNWNFTFVDPMARDYRGKEAENYREIVDLDKLDIRSADAVLVMYVKPSVGTAMEVFYSWSIGKPIITIDLSGKPLSPWLRYHSTAIVTGMEEAKAKLLEWAL